MFFAVFININIFKCIQIVLNSIHYAFLYIIPVKKKIQFSKGIGFRERSGSVVECGRV